jgi:FlaA1/EpsC-like NDP-sugar epimerase
MEDFPGEAVRVNVGGTRILANLSLEFGVKKFVFVSTDKAVNPTNVMGASKRISEIYVQSLAQKNLGSTQFITTRFGNVLGSNGSVIPLFKKQIENGGPVTVTHSEITRFFMTIPEACQLVLEASFMGNGGEIFIFDMGEPVKIYSLAEKMIFLSGLKPHEDIKIEITQLRPGEKLYEELLIEQEGLMPTYNDKIMIGKNVEYDYNTVNKQIEQLLKNADIWSEQCVVDHMRKLVPEFVSANSYYTNGKNQ